MWIYLTCSMDSTYSRASAESPRPWLPGCDQSPTVKSTDTLRRSWFLGWQRAHYLLPQFGMMSERFTEEYWQGIQPDSTTMAKQSMSLRAASHARTSALQEMGRAWQESEAAYSSRSLGSLANYDPHSSSWKTCQQSLLAEAGKWSESLPRWGMTQDGVLSALPKLGPTIGERDGFYLPTPTASEGGFNRSPGSSKKRPTLTQMARHNMWPTPTVHGNYNRTGSSKNAGNGLATAVQMFATPLARDYRHGGKPSAKRNRTGTPPLSEQIGGQLNPMWVEWLMGYPAGWTELKDWAMQLYRCKQGPLSKSLLDSRSKKCKNPTSK